MWEVIGGATADYSQLREGEPPGDSDTWAINLLGLTQGAGPAVLKVSEVNLPYDGGRETAWSLNSECRSQLQNPGPAAETITDALTIYVYLTLKCAMRLLRATADIGLRALVR